MAAPFALPLKRPPHKGSKARQQLFGGETEARNYIQSDHQGAFNLFVRMQATTARMIPAVQAYKSTTPASVGGMTGLKDITGSVLLSHDLSSDYHRRYSVSLPCSEWERVGPLCHDHQTAVCLTFWHRMGRQGWQTGVWGWLLLGSIVL